MLSSWQSNSTELLLQQPEFPHKARTGVIGKVKRPKGIQKQGYLEKYFVTLISKPCSKLC